MIEAETTALIIICTAIGGLFALYNAWNVVRIPLNNNYEDESLVTAAHPAVEGGLPHVHFKIPDITASIAEGAKSFLKAEYRILLVFIALFSILIFLLIGASKTWIVGAFSAVAFICGSLTSISAGYIGMRIATVANGRCAIKAIDGIGPAFVVAFKAGCVMGFALVSLGLIILFILISCFRTYFNDDVSTLYECIAGYGLGGSSVALFGRVGGGIYTKAADVGADLVGKIEQGIPEDDPRNPAVIADNVGDNVGDIAGMGADLFGSFAESSCAALVIAANNSDPSITSSIPAMLFPLELISVGILVCLATSFVATHVLVVKDIHGIEPSLKRQLLISTILATPSLFLITYYAFPMGTFKIGGVYTSGVRIYASIICGLWSGLIIGYITEYFTSHAYTPVRDVAKSCETGAATTIIYGLALGYKSVIIPIFCLAITICVGFSLSGSYGIAVAALGILSTLPIGLAIDAYGPISDNAGGIAEMAELGPKIRELTDALDAAGNTTAAIGKGFAIGSAALVSLALFGAFTTSGNVTDVDILQPYVFSGLLLGAMLPYWFSAMTMKSVGKAALAMVEEVRRQFREIKGIMEGTAPPDYKKCVEISTKASLKEMILPGCLVMLTPLVVGFLFGPNALCGVLAGNLVSGVQMAISSSNTGGAWDNAKKYIESGNHGGKKSPAHKAAVVGDTVGDPLKDTSGPSLNILVKLTAILSVVLAPFIFTYGGVIPKIQIN